MKKTLTLFLTLICTLASFAAGALKVSASEEAGVLTVNPASGNVESLKDFTISYQDGISLASATGAPIRILKQDQTEVASVALSTLQFEEVAEGLVPTYCTFSLSEAITDEGSYLLYIPTGIFTLGTGSNAIASSNQNFTYDVVAAAAPLADIVTDPADGSTVKELNKVLVRFTKAMSVDYIDINGARFTNSEGQNASSMTLYSWGDGLNELIVETSPITEAGTYTMTLPAGTIKIDDIASTEDYTFTYNVVGEEPKFYTTNPAEGNVESLSEIVITFTNATEAGVGGGKVTIKKDGVEMAKVDAEFGTGWNQLVIKYNATDNGTYTFEVPAGHVVLDGTDAPAFTLTYTIGQGGGSSEPTPSISFATLTPADGSSLDVVSDFLMTFSDSEAVGYGVWQLNDLNAENPDEANLYTGQLVKQEDGSWKAHAYYEQNLFEGHQYELAVTVYDNEMSYNYQMAPLGTLRAQYTGTRKAYVYAAANYIGATPEDNSIITNLSQKDVTIRFDAAVESVTAEVNGGLLGSTKVNVTPNEAKTEWTFTIPESTLSQATGSFNIVIVAKDAEGRNVKGNEGKDENSVINLTYLCYLGAPEFAVTPANGSTVEAITTIVASYAAGIVVSGSCDEPVRIYNGETVVAEISADKVVSGDLDKSGENYTTATITLAEPINVSGTYTVVFPTTFFMLDNQFNSCCSKEQKVEITVSSDASSVNSISATSGSDIIFTVSGQRTSVPVKGINIIGGKKQLIK